MARPRRRAPSVEVVAEQVTEELGEEFAEPVLEEASFFDSSGDDSYVMLWRRDDITKKMVYHGKLSPAEATEENVSAQFGGGEFLAREKKRLPDGRMVFGKQRSFVLAGAYKNPALQPPKSNGAAPVETPAAVAGSAVAGLPGNVNMEDIKMAGVLSLLQMTQQAAQAQATMQSQMQQMLLSTMTAQREGMEAIIKATASRPEEKRESPLEMIKTVVEMMKGVQSPKSDVKDLMEGMRSILEFRDELSPAKPSTGDTIMDSVPKMLDLVKEGFALKRMEGTVPSAPKTNAQIPATTGDAQAEAHTDMPIWQRVLLAQKNTLIRAASSGKDPEIAALAAVEFMPEGIRGAMTEFVLREDVLAQVVAVVPELQQFPNWITAFFTEVRSQLLPDAGGEGEGEDDGDSEEGS